MNEWTLEQLDGARVLVVEDRTPIAMELCDLLEDHGCVVVGPAGHLGQAMTLVDQPIDIGLLDIDLYGEPSYPVAKSLQQRGVPVVLITGFDDVSIPDELQHLLVFEKPIAPAQLLDTLARALNNDAP